MERPKKVTPHVVKMVGTLPKNTISPKQEIRVRVVRYRNQPRQLDIREFIKDGVNKVTGGPFTGYTPKGLTLNAQQLKQLIVLLAYVSAEELLHGLEEEVDTKRTVVSTTEKSEDTIINQHKDKVRKTGESRVSIITGTEVSNTYGISTITGTEVSNTEETEKESGNGKSIGNGSSESSTGDSSTDTIQETN